ncbi:hypothetical protein CW696_02830 [ANME-2 cluster archaeon]|nr:MAG: hypothetical protein CW696_02830 [ANME-2 cluster archaeon]
MRRIMIHRRKSFHSTGYLNDDGMIRRHRYFEFDVNNTQIISGLFSTLSGQEISVDWGDGSSRDVYTGTDQAWSHDYGSAGNYVVRIFGSVALTQFRMDRSGADISFDIANLPAGLTVFYCSGSATIAGDIANLPAGLTVFRCWSSGNTITGDIARLPGGITVFACSGHNTVFGDIANLPDGISYFYCGGDNTISDYSGKTWTTKPSDFYLIPASGGLSTAEVDQLLIDFDADLTWASGDAIELTGANAARSAASDAAVTNMTNEGATITTN